MIEKLVQSALQTGWLSVESEGLIRQILRVRGYQSSDAAYLQALFSALRDGHIQREGQGQSEDLLELTNMTGDR